MFVLCTCVICVRPAFKFLTSLSHAKLILLLWYKVTRAEAKNLTIVFESIIPCFSWEV